MTEINNEKVQLFEYECTQIREAIERIKKTVWDKRVECFLFNKPELKIDIVEMDENIKLSYRHLEDARMRLGKVMQALQEGVSIYDRKGKNIFDSKDGKVHNTWINRKESLASGDGGGRDYGIGTMIGPAAGVKLNGMKNGDPSVSRKNIPGNAKRCVICRKECYSGASVHISGRKKMVSIPLCPEHLEQFPKNKDHVMAFWRAAKNTKSQEEIYQDALEDIMPEIQRILKIIKPSEGRLKKHADEFIDAYGTELTYDILKNAKNTGVTLTQLRKYMKDVFEMRTGGTKK